MLNNTQNYQVHHSRDPLAILSPLTQMRELAYDFEPVAIVTATSPEEAFALTNQQDEVPWTSGKAIVWCKHEHLRSTSVGDVISNQAHTRSWLVLKRGFQVIEHLFYVKEQGNSITCEKRGEEFVLFFTPSSDAEVCWEAISRSGRWSDVLDESALDFNAISFPEDLVDETWLREVAEQFLDGKQQFKFSQDEDYWEEEYTHGEYEEEVESSTQRNALHLLGLCTWIEAIERFSGSDLELLRLAHEGACRRFQTETDPIKLVEAWALGEALAVCISWYTNGYADLSAFPEALEKLVQWVLFYSGGLK